MYMYPLKWTIFEIDLLVTRSWSATLQGTFHNQNSRKIVNNIYFNCSPSNAKYYKYSQLYFFFMAGLYIGVRFLAIMGKKH